jgi:hypothetical protein
MNTVFDKYRYLKQSQPLFTIKLGLTAHCDACTKSRRGYKTMETVETLNKYPKREMTSFLFQEVTSEVIRRWLSSGFSAV